MKLGKVIRGIGSAILVVLILLAIPFAVPKIAGMQVYEVLTGSMEPTYDVGTVIYLKKIDPQSIMEGDIVAFYTNDERNVVVTHRVVAIDEENGLVQTKGDANEVVDEKMVPYDRIIGIPTYSVNNMAWLAHLFQSTTGWIVIAALLVFVVILWMVGDSIIKKSTKNLSAEGEESETKKKKTNPVVIVIALVGFAMVIFATVELLGIFKDYNDSNELYADVNDKYVETSSNNSEVKDIPWYELVEIDLAGVKSQNEDVIGWLYFENEEISYPIMFSGDNDFYLRKSLDKSDSTAGSIFLEGQSNPDFMDAHTIVYGHNMRNGSMFGKLKNYKEEGYYNDHQYFQVHVDSAIYRYQIFAYHDVDEASGLYTVPFAHDDVFAEFIQNYMLDGSYVDSGVEVSKDDTIITLSTCSTTGNRFVVHAKLVDTHNK